MTLVRTAMRPIWRFARRTRVERRLLVQAFLLLLAITVGLRLMPLVSLQRVLSHPARKAWVRRDVRPSPDTVVWAVRVMSSYIPRATCLVRAVALQTLLGVYSWPSRLCIGFGQGAGGTLGGHAWVEAEGAAEIVEEGQAEYRCVLTLGADGSAV